MIKFFSHLVLIACMLACVLPASGQSSECQQSGGRAGWPFPLELDGTMMAYDFSHTDSVVPWDNSLEPVFVSYVARHGARFLSSEKKVEHIREVLSQARREGNLSARGERFMDMIRMVDSVTAGRWGALNAEGIREEKILGNQMFGIAPDLLKKGKVEARATYVPRVVMTMYELCHSLACNSSDIEVHTAEGRQFSPLLRFFKTDSAYMKYIEAGPWVAAYDRFEQSVTPCSPAAGLFIAPPDDAGLRKLTIDMYGILQSLPASGLTADAGDWFSEEEFAACWRVDNLRHYYQRSVSGFSAMPAHAASPLLHDIISVADSVLAGRRALDASLYFGHAETVIPLFSLMRLPGCYAPDCTPGEVSSQWRDWEVSPLGANLMIVFLKDSDGSFYVAMRLNGKWVDSGGGRIISWEGLKARWNSYMDS